MILKKIYLLCMLAIFLGLNVDGIKGEVSALSEEDDLELERQLKLLNKPARKSIKDIDGTIYDCIDIDKQPAFDNPLLKNHKIQMPEPLSPQETLNNTLPPFAEHVKIGIEGEECPEGTVIIRRTRKEELLWAKNYNPNLAGASGPQVAISSVAEKDRKYHGASGLFNVYRPYCTPDQFSAGSIWFQMSYMPQSDFNALQFGWMVHPKLFGDNLSRLYGHWTADTLGKTGCYNILCAGYIQISPKVTFGMVLKNSVYKKPYQLYMFLRVQKNVQSGDWWLYIGGYNDPIGYWPKALFTTLLDHATNIHWGGQAYGPPNASPAMGSGHMGRIMYASMMGVMQVVDESDNLVDVEDRAVRTGTSSKQCYDVKYHGFVGTGFRRIMYFGGGGGNNC